MVVGSGSSPYTNGKSASVPKKHARSISSPHAGRTGFRTPRANAPLLADSAVHSDRRGTRVPRAVRRVPSFIGPGSPSGSGLGPSFGWRPTRPGVSACGRGLACTRRGGAAAPVLAEVGATAGSVLGPDGGMTCATRGRERERMHASYPGNGGIAFNDGRPAPSPPTPGPPLAPIPACSSKGGLRIERAGAPRRAGRVLSRWPSGLASCRSGRRDVRGRRSSTRPHHPSRLRGLEALAACQACV